MISEIKAAKKAERAFGEPSWRYHDFRRQEDYVKLWKSGACCEICWRRNSNCNGLPNPCDLYEERSS